METSCDDTAAAVIADGRLLSSVISSQLEHADYGGVVPELASRAHQRMIVPVIERALDQAGVRKEDLDAVAVTCGPGLAGSLHVGVGFAKAMAWGLDIPIVGINHLEGHLHSLFTDTTNPPDGPILCLTASGGHTQIAIVDASLQTTLLGKTRDDAAGEAFDKVAQLLGLPYPGGPAIERLAESGNADFHQFPRTSLPPYDYSFSGIKTSVLYYLNKWSHSDRAQHLDTHLHDVCASFQEAMIDMLVEPVRRAIREKGICNIGLVGGVSANRALQTRLEKLARKHGGQLYVPGASLSMDNAAMIAAAGLHRLQKEGASALTLTVSPSLDLF